MSNFLKIGKTLLFSSLLSVGVCEAQVLEGRDFFLSSPYALKAAVPLALLAVTSFDPSSLAFEALALGVITLPNAMTLRYLYTGDAAGTTRWRRTTFWCDLGMGAAGAGLGTALLAFGQSKHGSERSDYQGAGAAILGFYGLPFLGFSLLDRMSFHLEKGNAKGPELNLSLQPGNPTQDKRPTILTTSDWFLSTPYALKSVLPLFLVPEALMDHDAIPIVAALALGVGLPNLMLLQNVYTGDAAGTQWWRTTVFWSELGLATAFAGMGVYLLAGSPGSSQEDIGGYGPLIGAITIVTFALPLYGLSILDRVPFDLEKHPARLSFGLGLPSPAEIAHRTALTLQLQVPI